jgi:hypothetical protein
LFSMLILIRFPVLASDPSKKSRDFPRGPFFSSAFTPTFLASLLFYLLLLPPSVTRGGDGGELISASYTLGIAHPSGYPIWCLLGRIFALLPWGEVAWRYNLFSALSLALAAGILAQTAYLQLTQEEVASQGRAKFTAIGAALLFTGFFFVGTQALLAEVYALAALEGAALIFFALRWKQEGDWRDLYALAFLAGLSPFIHLSGVFLWPILGVWALWRTRGLTAGRLLILVGLFGAGCIPALYLPIRSALFPVPLVGSLNQYLYFPLDWGHPATIGALKNHLSAAQYSGLLKPRPWPDLLQNLAHLGSFLLMQYLWATPLLLVGAWSAFKRRLGWVLAAIFVLNVGVEIQYDVSDQPNFFFPAYLVMTLWMALGWFAFFGWLEERGKKMARGQQNSLWPWRLRTIGTLLLLMTIGAQWFLFGISTQGRGIVRIRDGALESARGAEQLARRSGQSVMALWVADDTLWPFWYAKYVLGAAPHVETLWGRGVVRVQEARQMADYVAQLKKSGPVVLAQWDEGTDARFPLVMLTPSGNLCEASDRALPPVATPVSGPKKKETLGPNGLLAGKFRRAALWRSPDGGVAISPASMAAFEVDFRVSHSLLKSGFIEVLLAKEGTLKSPPPQQEQVSQGSSETGHVLVSKQVRRLILPSGAQSGQLLRAAVPLQIGATLPVGTYEVWTRLVGSKTDKTTVWTQTDQIRLTSK